MIQLFILAIIGSIFTVSIFFIEDLVSNMPPENRFRQWWRKWIVGELPNKIEE